jgi:hypothetical protein
MLQDYKVCCGREYWACRYAECGYDRVIETKAKPAHNVDDFVAKVDTFRRFAMGHQKPKPEKPKPPFPK